MSPEVYGSSRISSCQSMDRTANEVASALMSHLFVKGSLLENGEDV